MSEFVEKVEEAVEAVFTSGPGTFKESLVFGIPTLDRPFGVAVWPLFRYVAYNAVGYDIESFNYSYNSSIPMSSVPEVTLAIIGYYVVIFGGRWALQNVRPIRLSALFKLHNLILTLLSGILLILLSEQMIPIILRHGVFFSICNAGSWTQKIELIYYLNYLTKYYELLDTVFMVLRKRPLTFLHTYHHGATALLCFTQLNGKTPISYVPIGLNLAVHVLMYFYYLLAACGIRPWWKTWVTRFQIIQFIIDLGFVYFGTYTHFVTVLGYEDKLPNAGRCAGEESAAVDGCLILSSYLVLFVSFYIKSYVVPAAAKKAAREALATSSADSKKEEVADAPAEKPKRTTRSSSAKTAKASASSATATEAPKKRTTRSRKA